MPLTRRTLLATAPATLALTTPAPATPVATTPDQPATWAQTLATRAAALPGPGLLASYDTANAPPDFAQTQTTCAYTYDNAVAGLALLAAGNTQAATRIADALAHAQAHDRTYTDGRLRNAYRAGPTQTPAALPGWWNQQAARWTEDAYQAGTATGVLAWAMLLWSALGPAYRVPALRAADWIEANTRTPHGYAGGVLGFEPSPQRLTWVSTEHNTDCAAAFSALGRPAQAAHARAFVESMWQPGEGRFATGLTPQGTLNTHSALDANLWPLLAPNPLPAWQRALGWVLTRHGLPANGPAAGMDGVDFNTDRDGIWLEGTAITALALRHAGQPATRMLATLRANTAPSGLIYACSTPVLTTGLSTGLDTNAPDFLYYRVPHLAPTAWAALAQSGHNPFPA